MTPAKVRNKSHSPTNFQPSPWLCPLIARLANSPAIKMRPGLAKMAKREVKWMKQKKRESFNYCQPFEQHCSRNGVKRVDMFLPSPPPPPNPNCEEEEETKTTFLTKFAIVSCWPWSISSILKALYNRKSRHHKGFLPWRSCPLFLGVEPFWKVVEKWHN